jgi:hypothetical protein
VQPVNPSHALRQPCPGQHSASLILHLDVMVIFRVCPSLRIVT